MYSMYKKWTSQATTAVSIFDWRYVTVTLCFHMTVTHRSGVDSLTLGSWHYWFIAIQASLSMLTVA